MKLFEYANNFWVNVESSVESSVEDTPFLYLGAKRYTEITTYFKRRYNVDIVYTRYTSKEDGIYILVELKETDIDIKTLDIISGDCGKITIGADYSIDEAHPGGYSYLYLIIPIEQEVQTFNID